jgi:tRNA G18 (ribose-2'-O)-methylase SpoU
MERIHSLDDPRIAAYRNLRDRTLRGESIFLTEGRLLTLRLLESGFQAESVFCAEQFAAEMDAVVRDRLPLYVASAELMRGVVGFNFHRGVLARGRRPTSAALDDLMSQIGEQPTLRLVICADVTQPENLGLVLRSAAALGVDGVVLGERTCDPLSRRCLRLSMGSVFRVPYARAENLAARLRQIKVRHGLELIATVLDDSAYPLADFRWPDRVGLLVGNEFAGLRPDLVELCDYRVTIPMRRHVDSLNLGVATGIFIHEMTRLPRP